MSPRLGEVEVSALRTDAGERVMQAQIQKGSRKLLDFTLSS